jgi:hypothetical protein
MARLTQPVGAVELAVSCSAQSGPFRTYLGCAPDVRGFLAPHLFGGCEPCTGRRSADKTGRCTGRALLWWPGEAMKPMGNEMVDGVNGFRLSEITGLGPEPAVNRRSFFRCSLYRPSSRQRRRGMPSPSGPMAAPVRRQLTIAHLSLYCVLKPLARSGRPGEEHRDIRLPRRQASFLDQRNTHGFLPLPLNRRLVR